VSIPRQHLSPSQRRRRRRGKIKAFEIVNRGDSECASSYLRSDHPTERTRASHKLHNTTNRHKMLMLLLPMLLLSEREKERERKLIIPNTSRFTGCWYLKSVVVRCAALETFWNFHFLFCFAVDGALNVAWHNKGH